jgi:hypothetical protein
VTVPPEVGAPPTPPAVGDAKCTFPGKGQGPGGCPPGHGGIPPGQGGTPPGQFGRIAKVSKANKAGKLRKAGKLGKGN